MARIVVALTRSLLVLSCAALSGLAPPAAHGAGFFLFEQSGRGMGSAYAGEAAVAMDPTTIYYNPAGMVRLPGTQLAASGFGIYTRNHFNNQSSQFAPGTIDGGLIGGNDGGNGGLFSLVPSFFLTHQLHERFTIGLGISTQFGLETSWQNGWIGRYHARLSRLQTLNINPSAAFRVTDWFSVGGGVSAEWAAARLTNNIDLGTICQQRIGALGLPPQVCIDTLGLRPGRVDGYVRVQGDDWNMGWNVGMLFEPSEKTRIGLAYRSRIEHDLVGDADFIIPQQAQILSTQTGALVDTNARASATLPDRAAISLYHELTDQLHFLADVTWTNWSLFEELVIKFANPAQPDTVQPENWKDTMRYALGLVYVLDDVWSFRTGYAFDESPIEDPVDRTPRIPDSERHWLAIGLGIRPTSRIRIDFSYAHIFAPRVRTRNADPSTGNLLIGTFDAAADLFAFQFTYDVDWTFSDVVGEPML